MQSKIAQIGTHSVKYAKHTSTGSNWEHYLLGS